MKVQLAGLAALWMTMAVSATPLPEGQALSEVAVKALPPGSASQFDDRYLMLGAGAFDPVTEVLVNKALKLPDSAQLPAHGIVQFESAAALDADGLRQLGLSVLAYLPRNAYLVRYNGVAQSQIKALAGVRYSGDYRSDYKLVPRVMEWAAAKRQTLRTFELIGFPDSGLEGLERAVRKLISGVTITKAGLSGRVPVVRFDVPAGQAAPLARFAALDNVMWILPTTYERLHNKDSVGPIQNNSESGGLPPTATPIWDQDIIGTGQIVAVIDSGLDRNEAWFTQHNNGTTTTTAITNAERVFPPATGTVFPNNKVVAYWHPRTDNPYDDDETCGEDGTPSSFHGTHVAGSVAGDSGTASTPTSPGYDDGDGMAPNAQLLMQDVGVDSGSDAGCILVPGYGDLHRQAFAGGAFISSASIGSSPPTDSDGNTDPSLNFYFSSDLDVDTAAYEIEDMLLLFSAGNSADASSISHPANAKHALAVAANVHGNGTFIQGFSSRGPAHDGRIKPDLSAPGAGIISAAGDNNDTSTDAPTTSSKSGTSMAAPTVAGAAALMRQYFGDGFYPTGGRNPDDEYTPTGAMMKSVLLNGTLTNTNTPAVDSGWGRVWLNNNLYFSGDNRQARIWDLPNRAGLRNGEKQEYQIRVQANEEFRTTLAWFDPPGSVAAAIALVNDLDLTVTAPDGTQFNGNNLSRGVSRANGDPDRLNPVEQVLLTNPAAGIYTLTVTGASVPGDGSQGSTQQGYALVASSRQCDTAVVDGPTLNLSSDAQGVSLDIDAVTGAQAYQVYASEGSCNSADPKRYRFVGSSDTTSFLDLNAAGGTEYAYRVRAVDACGEGPMGDCKSIVSAASCKLFPNFNQGTLRASRIGGETCGVDLSWTAASTSCPGFGVSYNIYRSTSEGFEPAASNRIASAVTATSFTDLAVESLVTYYYVVRAEDSTAGGLGPNGGNESPGNDAAEILTAAGSDADLGYQDDPDIATPSTRDSIWRINNSFASTGTSSYHNALDGQNYLPDTCARIVSPAISLPVGGTPVLSYDASFNMELNWDGVIVEISTNGGATWQDLPPDGGYPSDLSLTQNPPVNACNYPASQGAFNGRQSTFRTFSSDLTAFAGQEIMIRYSFTSDPGTELDGFYLDNIQISGEPPGMCTMADLSGVSEAASGAWFSPGQDGHGWLIELLEGPGGKQAERINAYWYVYQDGAPVWLLGGGPIEGNSATLDMLITSGPTFPPDYNPEDFNFDSWGTLTFDFDSDTSGSASWSSTVGDFGSGTLPMTQLAPIGDSTASCQSGSYFDPEQSGHGFVAQVVNLGGVDNLILAWYVYLDGEQVWMLGIAPLIDNQAEVTLQIYSGADFPPDFDSGSVLQPVWGTVSIEFTGPDTASASWTSDFEGYGDGSIELVRLTKLEGHQCN
jgi:hypothetical protein